MSVERYNKMSLTEKLKDVISRNTCYAQVSIIQIHEKLLLQFKANSFGMHNLKYLFAYWGLDPDRYVSEWNICSNNNYYVKVNIWIIISIDKENCKHNFIKQKYWGIGMSICDICGKFKQEREGRD